MPNSFIHKNSEFTHSICCFHFMFLESGKYPGHAENKSYESFELGMFNRPLSSCRICWWGDVSKTSGSMFLEIKITFIWKREFTFLRSIITNCLDAQSLFLLGTFAIQEYIPGKMSTDFPKLRRSGFLILGFCKLS